MIKYNQSNDRLNSSSKSSFASCCWACCMSSSKVASSILKGRSFHFFTVNGRALGSGNWRTKLEILMHIHSMPLIRTVTPQSSPHFLQNIFLFISTPSRALGLWCSSITTLESRTSLHMITWYVSLTRRMLWAWQTSSKHFRQWKVTSSGTGSEFCNAITRFFNWRSWKFLSCITFTFVKVKRILSLDQSLTHVLGLDINISW